LKLLSFLQIAHCVWRQKEREGLCKLVSSKKKRGASKTSIGKPAKQALERSGLFLRKERNNLWDSFPSSQCQESQKFAMSSKINVLRRTGVWRQRYSEERQHHDAFSHMQKQVGKPVSLSPVSDTFFYVTDKAKSNTE